MKEYFKNIIIKATVANEYINLFIKFKELGWLDQQTIESIETKGYNKCRCDGYVYFHPESGKIYNKNIIDGTVWDVDYFFKMFEHISHLENDLDTNKSAHKIKCFEADNLPIIELYMNHFISVENASVIDFKIIQRNNDKIQGIIYYTKNNDIGN